jgi:hypothetical protein
MEDPSSTNEVRLKALQAACERHSELIRDAMNGMFLMLGAMDVDMRSRNLFHSILLST